jgi:hypothetical protein
MGFRLLDLEQHTISLGHSGLLVTREKPERSHKRQIAINYSSTANHPNIVDYQNTTNVLKRKNLFLDICKARDKPSLGDIIEA